MAKNSTSFGILNVIGLEEQIALFIHDSIVPKSPLVCDFVRVGIGTLFKHLSLK